ncbi:hypothetical protein SCLCIDRAFT_135972 [Scleroderma citrinum Foug A]|uniref:Uncharacterized protein n=1 Tax=Scleroderma citrinum Foug A TaxID=1036808 RepID=A0A0C2YYZ6_9AGAM|nr:hypothetical protein SCLCIDRAFT_135972 [Scleroderma citrinum Foug A]
MLAVLPFQLLAIFFLWLLGFRRGGVERGSFAARHQSRNYQGYIPLKSLFSRFQSYSATHHAPVFHFHDFKEREEAPITTVLSWLVSLSAVFILGREWGLWDVRVAANKLM